MRLFVALDVPQTVRTELARLQDLARQAVRGTFPASFHLTLKFLGEVPQEILPALQERLARIPFEPFPLQLTRLGHFGVAKAPRVLWVGTTAPPALLRLVRDIEAATPGLGDGKPFKGHLTLARAKAVRDPAALDQFCQAAVAALTWTVRETVLFESQLGPGGPLYRARLRIPCNPGKE